MGAVPSDSARASWLIAAAVAAAELLACSGATGGGFPAGAGSATAVAPIVEHSCRITVERYGRIPRLEASAEGRTEAEAEAAACERACAGLRQRHGLECADASRMARQSRAVRHPTGGAGEASYRGSCAIRPFDLVDAVGRSVVGPVEACADAWAGLCSDEAGCDDRLRSVEGLPVFQVVALLRGDGGQVAAEPSTERTCVVDLEVAVDGRERTGRSRGASSVDDAARQAREEACAALGLAAEGCTASNGVREVRRSTRISIVNGVVDSEVEVTLREVEPLRARGDSSDGMLAACSRAVAEACGRGGCSPSTRLLGLNGLPVEPPRPLLESTDLFGRPVVPASRD